MLRLKCITLKVRDCCLMPNLLFSDISWQEPGRGDAPGGPPKIGKNMIFLCKIVILKTTISDF
jgi:hypothetical protein